MDLPELPAGVWRHYKNHLYTPFGYGQDANQDGRVGVVYIGLDLDGAKPGPRLRFRDVDDFFAIVNSSTGDAVDALYPSAAFPRRFTYLGPTWTGAAA
jgi:hypothetical protein